MDGLRRSKRNSSAPPRSPMGLPDTSMAVSTWLFARASPMRVPNSSPARSLLLKSSCVSEAFWPWKPWCCCARQQVRRLATVRKQAVSGTHLQCLEQSASTGTGQAAVGKVQGDERGGVGQAQGNSVCSARPNKACGQVQVCEPRQLD